MTYTWEMSLQVYVNKDFYSLVEDVRSGCKKMGWNKMIGNKGGVNITLRFNNC
jgi:hypothetical protein